MCRELFESITSDEFAVSAGFISTPEALRHVFARSPEVRDIRNGLRQGGITEGAIRVFCLIGDEGFSRRTALRA